MRCSTPLARKTGGLYTFSLAGGKVVSTEGYRSFQIIPQASSNFRKVPQCSVRFFLCFVSAFVSWFVSFAAAWNVLDGSASFLNGGESSTLF